MALTTDDEVVLPCPNRPTRIQTTKEMTAETAAMGRMRAANRSATSWNLDLDD